MVVGDRKADDNRWIQMKQGMKIAAVNEREVGDRDLW